MWPMRKLAFVAAVIAALAMESGLSAWGMDVHRLITRHAIEGLPAEVKPFFAARADFIVEHSVDPDLWRVPDLRGKLGTEDPNHFLDYDGFKDPFPFTGVPREWDAVVQKYGMDLATRNGRLPWRAEEIFDRMVASFGDMQRGTPSYAAENVRYLAAIMAHYVEDAHQPFHAVENYDGQLTNQRGIHSRFETELVLRNEKTFKWQPVTVTAIADLRTFIFDTLLDDQPLAKKILDADAKATEGREFYDDGYFAAFASSGALAIAEQRASDAASGVASVWIAAWTKAGKPALPVDTTRTPSRIRR